MSRPPSPSTTSALPSALVVALLAAVVGLVAGLLGARLGAGAGSSGRAADAAVDALAVESVPGTERRVVELLEELVAGVAALREEPARGAADALPGTAQPLLNGAAEDQGAISTATAALLEALEQTRVALANASRPTTLPREIARESSPAQREALDELLLLDHEALEAAWRFAGFAEVLDAFGPPDELLVRDGTLVLHYFGTHAGLGFRFYQGAVIGIW